MRRFLVLLFLLFVCNLEASVKDLILKNRDYPLSQKIERYSSHFLDKPTGFSPLGEGKNGLFDKDPLYRFDLFDCTTFVETILALSLSDDANEFREKITQIRYKKGVIAYGSRNHFISLDWIPNNLDEGFISDITQGLYPHLTKVATANIDKKNWYRKKGVQDLQGVSPKKLEELQNLGESFLPEKAHIDYVEIKDILKSPLLLNKIPHGVIINVVRPQWDLTPTIGTALLVGHQGLAIWKKGKLYYRHATSTGDKIVKDVLFEHYFGQYINHSSIKGLNFLSPL